MKRFDPIPLIQAGGIQPFHGSTPQPPGDALMAMLRGATFSGANPMDASRGLQRAASGPSLLSLLSGHTVPPGAATGPGAWQITPDQRDRNSAHSIEEWRRRGRPILPPQRDVRNI